MKKSRRKKSFGRKKKKKNIPFSHTDRASNALVWVKFGVHSIYLGVVGPFRKGRLAVGLGSWIFGGWDIYSGRRVQWFSWWECRNVFKGSRVVSRPLPWKWLINGCLGDPNHTLSKSWSFQVVLPTTAVPPMVFFRAASQFWGSKTSQSRWSKKEPSCWVFSPPMNENSAPQSSIWSESPHKSGWWFLKKKWKHTT